jgi:hypothetical protein
MKIMKNLIEDRKEARNRGLSKFKQEWLSVQRTQNKIILLEHLLSLKWSDKRGNDRLEERKMWKKLAGASTSKT